MISANGGERLGKFFVVSAKCSFCPELMKTRSHLFFTCPYSTKDLYGEIAEGKSGCCWESYEVYRYLKSLGYILGRHGVPWTLKDVAISTPNDEEDTITKLLSDMQICHARLVFDVYLPNSRFKKCSPGEPSFVACFSGDSPPSKGEIKVLQKPVASPLMFCHIAQGRASFFSFNSIDLLVLP